MRRLISICVIAAIISGCAQKAAFEELADGPCTNAQVKLIDKHISGQIDAIAKRDWDRAYTFASKGFQSRVGVDEFAFIIGAQYSMLIENQGYTLEACVIEGQTVTQQVRVTSSDAVYNVNYMLSVDESVLGVESAMVNVSDTPLSA